MVMKNIFAAHYYDSSKIKHSHQLEGLELADFSRRFFALVIDLFLLMTILYVIGIILNYFGIIEFGLSIGISSDNTPASIPQVNNGTHLEAPEYLIILLKLSIPVLYFGLITWYTNGYTVGKRIFRIRVVSTNHRRLSLWHSMERALGYYASSLEFGFGFLQYFIDYNRRTVHDKIAETIVLQEKRIGKTRTLQDR